MRQRRPFRTRLGIPLVLASFALAAAALATEPRREDAGDLIVLHLRGSYHEMGRQQAELLGDVLREVYAFHRAEYAAQVRAGGLAARAFDALALPLWSWAGARFDASGMHQQIAGAAEVLGVPPREMLRAALALDASSTVFAATRGATADGRALLGRNVDWGDAGGLRRPLLVHFHPTNGDLAHISVAWPLNGLPTVGLNEAGFAISMNYFDTEPMFGAPLPKWPHRRALQTARSVEEGMQVFEASRPIGFAGFFVMADAQGAVAMIECRPSGCARFTVEGDWFAQANHARTPQMIPHDFYRSPDSSSRLAGMEAAVRRHVGALTPEIASRILRDRTGHAFANSESVGNLFVLNAVVVQPAAGLLWHSTRMQPHAPFGAYRAFSPAGDAPSAPDLPAAPELDSPAFQREAAAIAAVRRALQAQRTGRHAEARALWETAAAQADGALDPARLALARGWNLADLGELAASDAALAAADADGAPFDARLYAIAGRAALADREGRRDEALARWRTLIAAIDAHPEYTAFRALRALAEAGLDEPQLELPRGWWSVGVPR
jgi:hypothetical protein